MRARDAIGLLTLDTGQVCLHGRDGGVRAVEDVHRRGGGEAAAIIIRQRRRRGGLSLGQCLGKKLLTEHALYIEY